MSNPQAPHPQAHIFDFGDPSTLFKADARNAARALLVRAAALVVDPEATEALPDNEISRAILHLQELLVAAAGDPFI